MSNSTQPIPENAIQRVLFSTQNVHIYQIPPLTSTSGFSAASWTDAKAPTAREIFTARLRVLETSLPSPSPSSSADKITTSILLEDGTTGDLFAAAPYTGEAVVQQARDSSRFFAVRVQGEGGMRATLGVGFEERGDAFDFGVALGEARKVLEIERPAATKGKSGKVEERRDFSLKEGQSIHVDVGGKGRRQAQQGGGGSGIAKDDGSALFSIAPPPAPAKGEVKAVPLAPPPSSTRAEDFGFDDGEFGEFQ